MEQGSNKQIIRDAQSVTAVQNSDVRDSFNTTQIYDPFYRPSLDITPSLITKWWTVRRFWQISLVALTITSSVLTIIGKNIFQVQSYLPEDIIRYAWIYGIPLAVSSAILLLVTVKLTITGSIRLFHQDWLRFGKNVVSVKYRCFCPRSECGGVMKVEFVTGHSWRWVCGNNPAHNFDFDSTLVSSALKKGQLNEKFDKMIRTLRR
jgi:hypothetical protein